MSSGSTRSPRGPRQRQYDGAAAPRQQLQYEPYEPPARQQPQYEQTRQQPQYEPARQQSQPRPYHSRPPSSPPSGAGGAGIRPGVVGVAAGSGIGVGAGTGAGVGYSPTSPYDSDGDNARRERLISAGSAASVSRPLLMDYDERLLHQGSHERLTRGQIQQGYDADLLIAPSQPPIVPSKTRDSESTFRTLTDDPILYGGTDKPTDYHPYQQQQYSPYDPTPPRPWWRIRKGMIIIAVVVIVVIGAVVGGVVGGVMMGKSTWSPNSNANGDLTGQTSTRAANSAAADATGSFSIQPFLPTTGARETGTTGFPLAAHPIGGHTAR